jgi:hypothetical protein
MHPYRQITDRYRQLARRPRPGWLIAIHDGGLDDLVAAIREPLGPGADDVLRAVITVGRSQPDALTVVLYALLPALQARLGRTVTEDYRTDVLTDLTLVLLDSSLEGGRLAHRLANRAHNRTYKAALRTRTRGDINPTTITPCDPEQLNRRPDPGADIATMVAGRVDLVRFHSAVQTAIDEGRLSEDAWAAYRDHRLRRAIDDAAPVCGSHQRTTALRTARKLEPLVASYLHAA